MMHFAKPIFLSVFLATPHVAWADTRADAAFITEAMITGEMEAFIRDAGLRAYAASLSDALRARHVQIVDQRALLELLPEELSDPSVEIMRQALMDGFLQGEAETVADIALRLRETGPRSYETRLVELEETGSASIEEGLEAVTSVLGDDELAYDLALSLVLVVTLAAATTELSEVEADLTAPFMADILETDGIFRFPNRIARRDLIQEIRAANE